MPIDWISEKNEDLKQRYGFGFEQVLTALGEDGLLEDRAHPNSERYGHQRQMIVRIENYAWVVPYVQADEDIFLKTMFPSRQATKRYLEPKS
jgi:hypothetical protein